MTRGECRLDVGQGRVAEPGTERGYRPNGHDGVYSRLHPRWGSPGSAPARRAERPCEDAVTSAHRRPSASRASRCVRSPRTAVGRHVRARGNAKPRWHREATRTGTVQGFLDVDRRPRGPRRIDATALTTAGRGQSSERPHARRARRARRRPFLVVLRDSDRHHPDRLCRGNHPGLHANSAGFDAKDGWTPRVRREAVLMHAVGVHGARCGMHAGAC
jgi:hypothetical protein